MIPRCAYWGLVTAILFQLVDRTQSVETWRRNALLRDRSESDLQPFRNLQEDVRDFGCVVNLCFFLDGGRRIRPSVFQAQKDFADLIVAIVSTDHTLRLCALQYHDYYTHVSKPTQRVPLFLRRLHWARQEFGHSNPTFAINRLRAELSRYDRSRNKLVLFSRGGRRFKRGVLPAAKVFREFVGSICAVAVDGRPTQNLVDITGDAGRVVTFEGFFTLSEIVTDIVVGVCGLPCGSPGIRSC